jgi:poly-gamma-glutamate capsule biosynthesis protein CapA/YwtB (metallophosphatase superfamily)
MKSRVWMSVVVTMMLSSSCMDGRESASVVGDRVKLTLLGQSLIEHDPRAHFQTPLSSVLPHLNSSDIVFTNLEVPIAGENCSCEPTRTGVFFHGAGPEVLDYLGEIGVSLLALSNNHAWDFGPSGILSTIAEADARGITHAGTGVNVREATAPAYLDMDGFRIGLVSMVTANIPTEAPATESRPGVNDLSPGDSAAWDRNLASIRLAAESADVTLVYQHFQTDAEPGWQELWARAAIDAGADLYVSHGEPQLAGVEVYGGGVIFYGLGNFIFHTRTELGRYPPEVWQSVLVEVTLAAGGARNVSFTPVIIDEGTPGDDFFQKRGYPEVAEGDVAESILSRLLDLSRPYGTSMEIKEGRATLEIAASRGLPVP